MSIRARRINKIDYEKSETFNLSHSEEIRDWLTSNTDALEHLNFDGAGIFEISVTQVKELIEHLKTIDNEDVKYDIGRLAADAKWAEEKREEYIQYYCF